jgi:hypothetical protein
MIGILLLFFYYYSHHRPSSHPRGLQEENLNHHYCPMAMASTRKSREKCMFNYFVLYKTMLAYNDFLLNLNSNTCTNYK